MPFQITREKLQKMEQTTWVLYNSEGTKPLKLLAAFVKGPLLLVHVLDGLKNLLAALRSSLCQGSHCLSP